MAFFKMSVGQEFDLFLFCSSKVLYLFVTKNI